ncbi:TonB-dependent receptor domain-containing protein [Candidatus Zixiibacteriota bacterium]
MFASTFALADTEIKKNNIGKITGLIVDAQTKEPLIGTNVSIVKSFSGAISNTDGVFTIKKLKKGKYTLRFSHVGYETKIVDKIEVTAGSEISLNVELVEKAISLKSITVTPGRFTIMGTKPSTQQTLTSHDIQTRPQFSEDLFRAVQRLPGLTSNDFTAKFNVRGGSYDEVYTTIDGLQIYEPFHLKDIDGGVTSIVDVSAVESMDLMTGGYPASYGERMSGVFNIKTRTPSENYKRLSLGLSFMNFRALTEGTFNNNKGSWILSARRGYLDLVLKMADPENNLKPYYYDLFGKVQYKIHKNHLLSASFLRAYDDMHVYGEDDEIGDSLNSRYGNTYFWMTLRSQLNPKLYVQNLASVGSVTKKKWGQFVNNPSMRITLNAFDQKEFDFIGFKSDWEYELSKNYLIKFGFEGKALSSDYDYLGEDYIYNYPLPPDTINLDRVDSTDINISPSGEKYSIYMANRIRLIDPLTTEFGFRYDNASYSQDKNYSPRVNLVYNFSPETTIRAGWGYFYQLQNINEILVGDGESEFLESERAEHIVAGFEHRFKSGLQLRLEGYYKEYSYLHTEYRNSFYDIEFFPELEDDRVHVNLNGRTSKGLELYLKKNNGGKISWSLSYILSKVEDDISTIYFPTEDVSLELNRTQPHPLNQSHTIYADWSYRPNHKWQFNVAWQHHSGWYFTDVELRTTTQYVYLQSGEQWGTQHRPFDRVDIRINRNIHTSKGKINIYFEIVNLLNRKNIRSYDYSIRTNPSGYYLDKETENWFGLMPSLGITYDIGI